LIALPKRKTELTRFRGQILLEEEAFVSLKPLQPFPYGFRGLRRE